MPAQVWPPLTVLAYAQQTDLSGSDVQLTVLCLAAAGSVAIMSLVVMAVASSRVPRWRQGAMVSAVVWGLFAAGSIIQTMLARLHWSSEQALLLKTGYYDPTQASPAPAYPLVLWGSLACLYVAALAAMLILPRQPESRH